VKEKKCLFIETKYCVYVYVMCYCL